MALEKIKAVNVRIRKRFVETFTIAIGMFLALTYSSLFSDILRTYLPIAEGNLVSRLFIAAALTYVVILATIILERWRK